MPTRDSKGRFIKGSENSSKKELDEDKIIELYKSGLTIKEISKQFGYTDASQRVHALIKNEGISRRAGRLKGISPITQYGNKNPSWKGGKKISNGYKFILIGHNNYLLEHQYVWLRENTWGMWFIPKKWVVHHKNKNRLDNRIENLVCIPLGVHTSLHNMLRADNKKIQEVV